MHPFAIFLLAITSPLLLAVTLLLPAYIGIAAAAYIIYYKSGAAAHPLTDKLFDVFYMLDVYSNLLTKWVQHKEEMSFWTYSIPLLGLPLFFTGISIWLTIKLARKVKGSR